MTPDSETLVKLAAYLESLPVDYEHFGMALWFQGDDEEAEAQYALKNGGVASCGTVACAVGHGPAAGILVPRSMVQRDGEYIDVDWGAYAGRFIGDWAWGSPGRPLFNWLFEDEWARIDDTHWGAAARIRYLLANGSPPEDFIYPAKLFIPIYAPYRLNAKAPA